MGYSTGPANGDVVTVRASARRVALWVGAAGAVIAASQAQLVLWWLSQRASWSPHELKRAAAVVALGVLVAAGGRPRRGAGPGGRPAYPPFGRLGGVVGGGVRGGV